MSVTTNQGGAVSLRNQTVKNTTVNTNIQENESVTFSFKPDNGYKISSVKVNGTDITNQLTNNTYTLKVTANISVFVTFEKEASEYTLSVTANQGGTVAFNNQTVKNTTLNTNIQENESVTFSFKPDNGYKIYSVKVNGTDITDQLVYNTYTIKITTNISIIVYFKEENETANQNISEKLSILGYNNTISINGAKNGDKIYIYTINGNLITNRTINSESILITVPSKGIYIVKIAENVYKIILQ